ncbi:MAG: putative endonuclease lcl3 [Bathelium mastoideum]|nr:MAG: putative endonuclease lcl3 [Bathelium mastoideum]
MRWPWSSDSNPNDKADNQKPSSPRSVPSLFHWWFDDRPVSWRDTLNAPNWQRDAIVSTLLTGTALFCFGFYRSWLRRVPTVAHLSPDWYRTRRGRLLGRVTSVGDGDNFRLFHTPGGRLAGWGIWRRVPTERNQLRDRTLHIRLAGIDAPECAHFGRPAQPHSDEALAFLREFILHQRVRAHIFRQDQYGRVVAQVFVRPRGFLLPRWRRRDVGEEMLRRGWATVYEAKDERYSEFGGRRAEYEALERRAKERGIGMWAGGGGKGAEGKRGLWERVKGWVGMETKEVEVESPREYKNRMAREETEGKKGEK